MKNSRGLLRLIMAGICLLTSVLRAIALSLQEAAARVQANPILISDEEEVDNEGDEDAEFQRQIQRAIEASKAEGSASAMLSDPSKGAQPRAEDAGSATSTFLSERALMERDRLERQKRLRPDTSFEEKGESSKRQQLASTFETHVNGKTKASVSTSGASRSNSTPNIPTIDQVFWEGEVRQVANRFTEPRKDGRPTFRLTDVLGKVCFAPLIWVCRDK